MLKVFLTGVWSLSLDVLGHIWFKPVKFDGYKTLLTLKVYFPCPENFHL